MVKMLENIKRPATTEMGRLVEKLTEKDPVERKRAREILATMGKPAIEPLIPLLNDRRPHVRWEAVKTLGSIGHPHAAPVLIYALEDDNGDIRWVAAEGLIDLGYDALEPLLSILASRPSSPAILEGAHHVFHELNRRKLRGILEPVLAALNGSEPRLAVPLAAYAALNVMKESLSRNEK